MKKHLVVLAALALPVAASSLFSMTPSAIAAPAAKSKSVKSMPASKAPKNAPVRPSKLKGGAPAPASKGGKKTKDSEFILHVDSRSDNYVQIFVDGHYRGEVEPWGDGYYYVGSGPTHVFARDEEDGGVWDTDLTCYGGTYTLTLR